jgi:hypothetical protein
MRPTFAPFTSSESPAAGMSALAELFVRRGVSRVGL